MLFRSRDYIFTNQNGENQGTFSRNTLLEFAKRLSLDEKTFTECLDSSTHYQDVMDSNEYAMSLGINSTPSVMVNGELVELSNLVAAIEEALK